VIVLCLIHGGVLVPWEAIANASPRLTKVQFSPGDKRSMNMIFQMFEVALGQNIELTIPEFYI
jgi:hypothetical protein